MRRRSRAGGKSLKARRRKAPTRHKAPTLRRRRTVAAGDGTKTAQLARERNEALGQLSAASEVLNVINSSPGDLQAVFAAILSSATRICQARFGTLYRFDGEKLHFAAEVGAPGDLAEFYKQREPHLPPPGSHIERVVRTKRPSQTADYTADAVPGPAAKFARAGSTVWVPMLKNGVLVGVILVYRQEIRLFTDRQIALLQNFAAQAVIAIENARLLNELRESLEQQTATADVLGVISKSQGDLEQVFQSILENATRLCEARFGNIFQFVRNAFHFAARVGTPPELAEFQGRRGPFLPVEGGSMDRMMRTKQVIHVVDNAAEAVPTPAARLGGARSTIDVPMIKDGALVGAIAVYRQEVRPFSDKQIALVQNLAAQAVIAIENARLLNELRRRTNDLSEALAQQTATSEVLGIISKSPGELEPVFQAMLENATRICEARFGILFRCDRESFEPVALFGVPPALAEFLRQRRGSFQPIPGSMLDRVLQTKQMQHTADYAAEASPGRAVELGGARSTVDVPMLKDGALIGAISIYRQEVRPFTDKQIDLVQNFAAQAVIAIENTRLLSELRQRTADLTESLEQQTATSQVLSVISSSPGDLEPVFVAMLANAVRICGANFGSIYRWSGDALHLLATHNTPPAFAEARRNSPFRPGPDTPTGRMVATKTVTHVADLAAEPRVTEQDDRDVRFGVDVGGIRTLLSVPMMKDDELVGAFTIYRQEVRPFTDKQIELVQNFAAQAVIAIENARLLSELRESLENQTASADVLRAIASSPESAERALDVIAETTARRFGADNVNIRLLEGQVLRYVGSTGPMAAKLRELFPEGPLDPDLISGKAILERRQIYIHADDDGGYGLASGVMSNVATPLMRQGQAIGAFMVTRSDPRPFSECDLAQLSNFAAQAVIAIENTRLLSELRESLERQTATSEVLRVISASPGELEPVFQAMLENATRICEANFGTLFHYDGQRFHVAAEIGTPPDYSEFRRQRGPFAPRPGGLLHHVTQTKQTTYTADNRSGDPGSLHSRLGGARSRVCIPMLKDDALVGAISIYRQEVRPFTDKQIELVQNFAAQAVIAIENTRLLNELRQRTEDLSTSLDNLRTTQDRLVQTQKLASLGQLTAGIAHEIKNPLNFVNNFSGLSVELLDELQEAVASGTFDDKRRSEIAELTDTLRGNLDKIAQHGKRADSIVKNMLLHSREGSGERRLVNVNALVEESLNLAYHGARAEKQGFTITLERSFDPEAGEADLFPQEITRVLLNLIGNGFYAASKRQGEADSNGYEPILTASTRSLGDKVEIRIRDNGTGIPPEVKEKLFNPFFTTKPAGEGTGLGLSISHDIIVKQHAGAIEVDTNPGEFTEFRIILPRTAG